MIRVYAQSSVEDWEKVPCVQETTIRPMLWYGLVCIKEKVL